MKLKTNGSIILTIIWAMRSKLSATLTKANFPLSVLELYVYSDSSNNSYQ